MLKKYLECGKIVSLHGLRGEVKVYPWGDSPEELADAATLYFDEGGSAVEVENARVQKNMVIMKIKGVDTAEDAQKLRSRVLYMDREDQKLDDGQYYVQDLIGMEVFDTDTGERYGELCGVSPTGANDVYHIRFADGGEKLIPAIPQVIIKVDIAGCRMEIRPLEGLFDI